jgi:hypothetical protein
MILVGLPTILLRGDLVVESVVLQGQEIPVQFTVTNDGTGVLDPVTVDVVVIDQTTGMVVATFTQLITLSPGVAVTGQQLIPGTLPLGDYLLLLQVGMAPASQTVASVLVTVAPQPDTDGDGVDDVDDACPNSNLDETVVIDGCNTGVVNQVLTTGCSFSDEIAQCAGSVSTHGDFVSCVAALSNEWASVGIIANNDKGKIDSCAARSDIP